MELYRCFCDTACLLTTNYLINSQFFVSSVNERYAASRALRQGVPSSTSRFARVPGCAKSTERMERLYLHVI